MSYFELSAARVAGPTKPSGSMPSAFWNAITAALVMFPK